MGVMGEPHLTQLDLELLQLVDVLENVNALGDMDPNDADGAVLVLLPEDGHRGVSEPQVKGDVGGEVGVVQAFVEGPVGGKGVIHLRCVNSTLQCSVK